MIWSRLVHAAACYLKAHHKLHVNAGASVVSGGVRKEETRKPAFSATWETRNIISSVPSHIPRL